MTLQWPWVVAQRGVRSATSRRSQARGRRFRSSSLRSPRFRRYSMTYKTGHQSRT
eukprot:CAMPEP_0197414312 /NCGR_PEP_ID=MMETSP1170-20131217/1052_1 /TAXON_ID=54406 /ORGANISM="Sarcinochrysis sp, Strain CCMP770" /LENGTH=54 /DNA_ID=CAMNT_0042941015 /DNA_START=486 /DNA_END=650 /DNA_ORIENTATION=+